MALLSSPAMAMAGAAPPPLADCDAGFQAVLAADAHAPAQARALWLDRRTLLWPGAGNGPAHRYRLYHAPHGGIRAEPGRPVAGATGAIALHAASFPADAAVARRFAHAGEGAILSHALDDGRLRELLRQALVLVREDPAGRVLEATALQHAGALDDLYAGAVDAPGLGAHPSAAGTAFGVWAPTARAVSVCLYEDDRSPATRREPLRLDPATGLWTSVLPGDLRGRYYTYLVDAYVRGVGLVRNRVTDPYAASLGADSRRSYVADLDDPALAPPGWDAAPRPAPLRAQADMSIYELHVRDFSIGDASVPPAHRGKYLAFTDARSAGMAHLRELARAGLTDLHLLPVYDFASVPEAACATPQVPEAAADSPAQQAAVMAQAARDCFNWGYDPFHFNAPEGSYASDPFDGAARIRQFRAMVMALHALGLRVGMDVVYNHTYAAGQDEASVLDRIVPGYYHRLDAAGNIERSTCCENTATEHAMMARLMIDSAEWWVRHYRIDSFRFDLMGQQPRAAMEALQRRVDAAAGRRVQLIGEGWNFGEVADGARFVQASQLSLAGSGIGTFSDRARDALRGGGPGDRGRDKVARQGWLNGLAYAPNDAADPALGRADLLRAADLVRVGLAGTLRDYVLATADGTARPLHAIDYNGQPAGYAAAPGEVVNYVENHDNETLYDLNAYRLPAGTPAAERVRVQVLGMTTTALSQGVAYFHAGVDTLRSKSMDRNSFDSGDWFNRMDWTYRDNFFGTGLPPASGNGQDWPWIAPRLADASIKPAPADIAFARDALRDLLRIRASSSLFRLRSAEEVSARLVFPNSGPAQNPLAIAGHLDGRGHPGAGFGQVLYLINAAPQAQVLELPSERGKRYVLHPVHRAPGAADHRPREQARFDSARGRFTVPPRTALVYVLE
ncbi:pullulanase-type alpha-1,6-glucosidase [Pseudoxanthomonas broegbernensis]|nr:pullulanase-type alpha-1,6-glucosidase [Pseudoxanthomonas broegbernensis]MBB6065233.1 pullulanase-type alpha-1,6-glucosidase [Pseudoxanthomonas broegbernensis]